MRHKVIISKKNKTFPMDGLNELLQAQTKVGNRVKRENDKVCLMAIRKCLKNLRIENPIKCTYYVYVKDKRHDRGNLHAAIEKSFLDALQTAKVIRNDGFDDVLDSTFHTYLDRENPRIVVEIIEVEKH